VFTVRLPGATVAEVRDDEVEDDEVGDDEVLEEPATIS
jgi:hypothetical protein